MPPFFISDMQQKLFLTLAPFNYTKLLITHIFLFFWFTEDDDDDGDGVLDVDEDDDDDDDEDDEDDDSELWYMARIRSAINIIYFI